MPRHACRGQAAKKSDAEAGPAAAWWEEWEEEQPASRKRRHPTTKPTAEDEQQDQGLANMTTQVCTRWQLKISSDMLLCLHFQEQCFAI